MDQDGSMAYVVLGMLMMSAVLYALLLVVLFLRHEGRVSGAVIAALIFVVAEGWIDPLGLGLVVGDRWFVILPVLLNTVTSWAVLIDCLR